MINENATVRILFQLYHQRYKFYIEAYLFTLLPFKKLIVG
jgi:hypothetical protein